MWRILFRQRPCQVFLRRRVLASNMNCLNEFCSAHVDARQLTHCGPLDGDSKACHGPLSRLMPQLLVVSPDSKPLQLAKLRHLQAAKAASFRDCFRDQRPSGHQAPTKPPPSGQAACFVHAKRLNFADRLGLLDQYPDPLSSCEGGSRPSTPSLRPDGGHLMTSTPTTPPNGEGAIREETWYFCSSELNKALDNE